MDQGPGIPADESEVIFDKFTQSSSTKGSISGTGLGLSICKKIAELHNGKIFADNRKDSKGAVFSVLIPIS
jgi:signal transduction histidine kinase